MAIDRNISAIYGDNSGDQRCAVQIRTPVLIQDMGIFVRQEPYALPDSHSVLEVLALPISLAGCMEW